jgi:hypothetical protein
MSNGMAVGPVRRAYPEVERPAQWVFHKDDAGDVYEVVGLSKASALSFVSVIEERTFPAAQPPAPTDYSPFLTELAALTLKHGVVIAGCGCCGSPFLLDCDDSSGRYVVDKNGDDLEWRDE